MKRARKNIPITFFVIMCFLICTGFYLIKISHNAEKKISVNYNEKSNIDYKVYLKENTFFETPYLEKNRTYIASLIDYVLINFNYTFHVDASVKGSYTYYIKGTVSANKNNSKDYYWSKDYILTEKKTESYENVNTINISSEAKVDYQVYNNLLNDFKSQYGVTMDGLLNVSLVVENSIESDLIDRTIVKSGNIDLNIPLTSLTIEVPIEASNLNNSGELFSDTVIINATYYNVIKIIGYLCFIISGILFILIMYMVILISKYENKYNKTLKKILKTYDSIIVNATSVPDTSSLNLVHVSSFDELIDAHGEVRQPINYIREKNHAMFILINDAMAWQYDLYRENFMDRK